MHTEINQSLANLNDGVARLTEIASHPGLSHEECLALSELKAFLDVIAANLIEQAMVADRSQIELYCKMEKSATDCIQSIKL